MASPPGSRPAPASDGGLRFFQSRVARRFLLVFIACALLPTAGIAVLSFRQVTTELGNQSRTRLRQTAKSVSMSIIERLVLLGAELETVAEAIPGFADEPPVLNERTLQRLRRGFEDLGLARGAAPPVPLLGSPEKLPILSPDQVDHLRSGGTVIATEPVPGALTRVHLLRKAGEDLLTARIRLSYLWGIPDGNNLPSTTEFCVLDAERLPLACSLPGEVTLPPDLVAEAGESSSGFFDWRIEDEDYLASYRTIFLKGAFRHAKWVLVLAESQSNVLAPIKEFRRTFPVLLMLALWTVLFISVRLIRRSLVPLEKLQRGTRRIAMRDFNTRVHVQSGDEFEELAESFNRMAKQLGSQFTVLSAIAEIDRIALEGADRDRIVDTVLTKMLTVYHCDVVGFTLVDREAGYAAETHVGHPRRDRRTVSRAELSVQEIEELKGSPGMLLVGLDKDMPSYLEPVAREGVASAVVLPLFFSDELLGAISLGLDSGPPRQDEEIVHARSVADQVSIALSNAAMVGQIRSLAYFDSLTGLPNRVSCADRLKSALLDAKERGTLVAVFMLDLDRFKRINDTFGHQVGDQLLQAVADRLADHTQQTEAGSGRADTHPVLDLARLGGDEFVVILTDLRGVQNAGAVAGKILASLSRPFNLGAQEVIATGSIGIAVYPFDGSDQDALLKNADTAMYHAKDEGRDNFQFYRRSMNEMAALRLTIESKLRQALEREEFYLLYQPVVELSRGTMVGVEALLRWNDPEVGVVPPADFIPIAEETGLIVALGDWVLRTACQNARNWHNAGLPLLRMAVNVSPRQFTKQALLTSVRGALRESGLEPGALCLEITENLLMQRKREAAAILQELRSVGIKVSIDDFGTGYSSFGYLKHFPLDSLKIDRSFVCDLATDPDDAAITTAIIAMAHRLGLRVIAEGVEHQDQAEFLRKEGCDEIPGFLCSKPVPADEIALCLREGGRLLSR
ncbi:MAG: EAL domain-containing protein [Myxococcota bacterium]